MSIHSTAVIVLTTVRKGTGLDTCYAPPGTQIDLPDPEAQSLIERGLAVPAETLEAVTNEDGPDLNQIVEAIDVLEEADFSKDGKPKVKALSDVLEVEVSATERDAAWSAKLKQQEIAGAL